MADTKYLVVVTALSVASMLYAASVVAKAKRAAKHYLSLVAKVEADMAIVSSAAADITTYRHRLDELLLQAERSLFEAQFRPRELQPLDPLDALEVPFQAPPRPKKPYLN